MKRIIEGMFPEDAKRLRKQYWDVAPPCLDEFDYKICRPPAGSRLKAWDKARETERRLALAFWAMGRVEPELGTHRVLAEDLIGAYFHAFEAVFQVLRKEIDPSTGTARFFDQWLASHPANTPAVRGIRTIRSLAVHVEDVRSTISVVKGHGGTLSRFWRLPRLTAEQLETLDRPKLRPSELGAWHALLEKWSAGSVMQSALEDLMTIVKDAEERAGDNCSAGDAS